MRLRSVAEAFRDKATPGIVPQLEAGVEHDRPTAEGMKLQVIDELCVGCSYCLMACQDDALIVEGLCEVIETNCTDCLRGLLWGPTGALVYA
jgi:Na+-translocating ferredoxin:NAD+ oxidoreductase RNF subunit RnfB